MIFTQFFKSDAPWNESELEEPEVRPDAGRGPRETDDAKRKKMYGDMQVLVA